MPTVGVNRDKLFEKLGRTYTDEQFEDLCFEYGIELDDVTTEKEQIRKEHSAQASGGAAAAANASEEVIYKIDIPANRYDMLCVEGIARALRIFCGTAATPSYSVVQRPGQAMEQMIVRPETAIVRPFIVCAILRGLKFDTARYNSFIELQDKLHQNLCRQRTLVSVGTHDLGTIKGPFTYEALPRDDIRFVPLNQTKEFVASELMQHYLDNDRQLRKYVPIIKDSVVYPVVLDANRVVLSLPPIINSAHSAISLRTRDVFIEVTATDLTKARVVLNTMCCMFAEYAEVPFQVEPVQVTDAFGETHVYPDLSSRPMEVDASYINGLLGLSLSPEEIRALLAKMQLVGQVTASGTSLSLLVPPTRSDILHACDVMEDVAIAYGYNNLPKHIPTTSTQGMELPINQLTELLRVDCAAAGYSEVLTWALCSRLENFDWLRRPLEGRDAVEIGNPATAEFEVCRTSLLPGALKTLGANKENALPIKLFEISDVILIAPERETGARNERRLAAVFCGRESSFEMIHGLLNRVMEVLGVPYKGSKDAAMEALYGGSYEWKASQDPTFFPGRQAQVLAKGQPVGIFGVVHPEVLEKFEIPYPVAALELNLEPFCFNQYYQPLMQS